MPVDVGKTVLNIVFWTAMVIIIIAGVAMVQPRIRTGRMLGARRAALERENTAMQQQLAALERQQARFRDDPEFVEHVARQNRRARPGEIVFIFDMPAD
jgi:cell division protein FtsB